MKTIRHTIKLEGEAAHGARVSVHVLRLLSDAIVETSQRALRFRIDGRSHLQGKATWLDKATDFELVGLEAGSTVLAWEAPTLGDAAPQIFNQQVLWDNRPGRDQSAWTIMEDTAREAASGNAESDFLDRNILDALVGFRRVLDVGYDAVVMDGYGTGSTDKGIRITSQDTKTFDRLRDEAPPAERTIVTGWLDELSHSKSAFRLRMQNGQTLRGLLPPGNPTHFASLWGRRVVIDGEATFRPSGNVSLVIASNIQAATDKDSLWERLPLPRPRLLSDLKPRTQPPAGSNGMEYVFGHWPGTETDEEIAAALEAVE